MGKRRQTTQSFRTGGLWARSESRKPEQDEVPTNHVPCIFCFKFQNKIFLASSQTVQRIGPRCNESGHRVQRISFSLLKEDKYAVCVLYSLKTSSRTWIGNHDSHLETSVTYSMFIFRPVNTHCLFTRILGSHMLTNDNIDVLVARIKAKQAMYYNVPLRRVRVATAAVENKKYYIFWLCVCSLSYPACKAHAPYYIITCGLSDSTLFFHVAS